MTTWEPSFLSFLRLSLWSGLAQTVMSDEKAVTSGKWTWVAEQFRLSDSLAICLSGSLDVSGWSIFIKPCIPRIGR